MKTTKKVIGVILALTMLLNVFSMISFAMTPDTAYELTLSTDKNSYLPGEEVTFTLSVETDASIPEVRIDGSYAIGYNSDVIDVPGDKYEISSYQVTPIGPGYDEGMSAGGVLDAATIDATHNWNAGVMVGISSDFSTIPSEGKVDLVTFKMKLSDTVADGDYVVGFNRKSYEDTNGYFNDAFTFDPATAGVSTANVFAFNDATIHVGAAVTPLTLTYGGAQIRFDDVGENGTYDTHKDGKFDVRTIAKISTEDFLAAFGSEDGAKDPTTGIKEFGFVYRAKSKDAKNGAFSLDTAKGIVDGTKTDATYEKVSLEYIQRTSDGYLFTCVINDIADTDIGDGVNCLAFVKYGPGEGQYVFFDDVKTADYTELHTTRVPGYKA